MIQQIKDWHSSTTTSTPSTGEVLDFDGRQVRVTLSQPHANWADVVIRRLNHLCGLPDGWDGYRGRPTRFDIAYFAFELLRRMAKPSTPAPSIVPLPSGGVQMEWHLPDLDIEIAVREPNEVSAWLGSGGHDEEFELNSDFTKLSSWFDKLG